MAGRRAVDSVDVDAEDLCIVDFSSGSPDNDRLNSAFTTGSALQDDNDDQDDDTGYGQRNYASDSDVDEDDERYGLDFDQMKMASTPNASLVYQGRALTDIRTLLAGVDAKKALQDRDEDQGVIDLFQDNQVTTIEELDTIAKAKPLLQPGDDLEIEFEDEEEPSFTKHTRDHFEKYSPKAASPLPDKSVGSASQTSRNLRHLDRMGAEPEPRTIQTLEHIQRQHIQQHRQPEMYSNAEKFTPIPRTTLKVSKLNTNKKEKTTKKAEVVAQKPQVKLAQLKNESKHGLLSASMKRLMNVKQMVSMKTLQRNKAKKSTNVTQGSLSRPSPQTDVEEMNTSGTATEKPMTDEEIKKERAQAYFSSVPSI